MDCFAEDLQDVLRKDLSVEYKWVLLFVFLSYTAVLEEQLTRSIQEQEKSRKSEEEMKKKVKKSIQDDQLNN